MMMMRGGGCIGRLVEAGSTRIGGREGGTRKLSFSVCLSRRNVAAKYKRTIDQSQMLTYEMACRPDQIGMKKAWLTWHSQDLEDFRLHLPQMVEQDEVVRRLIRGFFPGLVTRDGSELVLKRRGNMLFVAGFLQHSNRLDIRRIYWMFGFVEELLSLLLKQPVKLELQFVASESELAYKYI